MEVLRISFFFVSLIYVAYCVLKCGKVPVAQTLLLSLSGMCLLAIHKNASGLIMGMICFTIGFVPFYLLYRMKGLQLGEAMLMGLVGALGGAEILLHTYIYTAVIGFFLALATLWKHRQLHNLGQRLKYFCASHAHVEPLSPCENDLNAITLPYGFVIVISAYLAFIKMVF